MVKKAILVAVTSDLTMENVVHMTSVIFYLAKHYFNELCQWLPGVLGEEGFPGPAITRQKKEEFATCLLREKTNKRKMQEVMKDFAATCISLQGTAGVTRK